MNSCSIGATSCGHTSPSRPIVIAVTEYTGRYIKTMSYNALSCKHFCQQYLELALTPVDPKSLLYVTVGKSGPNKHGNKKRKINKIINKRSIILAQAATIRFPTCCSVLKPQSIKGDWCRKSSKISHFLTPCKI